jgi:hypothetical protein
LRFPDTPHFEWGSWAKSREPHLQTCQICKSDGMPMLDYLVIVLAFAIVCGATLLFMKVTG